MFRKLTRINQQITEDECRKILKNEPRGVLSVIGDNGYPYALPINFYYEEAENKIYFHGGKEGHKMDAIRNCDKASFCVYDKGFKKDGHWSLNIRSVIIFGRIKVIENWSYDLMRIFSQKYTQDSEYTENEIRLYASKTAVMELSVEHMTGKIVNEA